MAARLNQSALDGQEAPCQMLSVTAAAGTKTCSKQMRVHKAVSDVPDHGFDYIV